MKREDLFTVTEFQFCVRDGKDTATQILRHGALGNGRLENWSCGLENLILFHLLHVSLELLPTNGNFF